MTNPIHQIYSRIKAIAETPKTSEKSYLLGELLHIHNPYAELAFEILRRTYCGRVVYGIGHLPLIRRAAAGAPSMPITEVFDNLDLITTRTVTGNAARDLLKEVMSQCDDETAEILYWMVNKDARAGFGVTLINKVSKVRQIAEVPYMRCSLANNVGMGDWAEWTNGEGVFIQLKADGMFNRCNATKFGTLFVSRQGEVMPNEVLRSIPDAIQKAISDLGIDGEACIDGEFTMRDPFEAVDLPRKESNGIFNSHRQSGKAIPHDTQVVYSIWDVHGPQFDGWPYEERLKVAEKLAIAAQGYLKEGDTVVLIESERVYSLDKAIEICQSYMLRGLEGAVAKKPSAKFVDGTSTDQVKMKIDFDFEAKIVGYVEGKPGKKTAATFGSIKFESACGLVRGSASGIKDADRERINADREGFLGSIIQIRGNDLTQNRDEPGFWAVSHPRVTEFRTDKTEADDYQRIRDQFEAAKLFKLPPKAKKPAKAKKEKTA